MKKKIQKQPKKQLTKQQQSNRDDYFSTFVALGIVLFIPFVILVCSLVGNVIDDISYIKEIKKGDHINIEKDMVVLTYPAGMFMDEEALEESIETLKNSDGMKKVVKNDDGSITALMTIERYEDNKEAAMYTAQSLPYISIGEDTAVRDLSYNEEMTVFDLVVNKASEKLQTESMNLLSMVSLYHVCNMNSDALITVNYKDEATGELYLTEVYDINRNKVN